MNIDDIVMVNVSRDERRPFYNLARLRPSKIEEGVNTIEATFAKGSPRETRVTYTALPKSEWKNTEKGEDYFIADGIESYYQTPPKSVVWFEGCLFKYSCRVSATWWR